MPSPVLPLPSPQATPKPVGNRTVFRLLGTNFGSTFFATRPPPAPSSAPDPKGSEAELSAGGGQQRGSNQNLHPEVEESAPEARLQLNVFTPCACGSYKICFHCAVVFTGHVPCHCTNILKWLGGSSFGGCLASACPFFCFCFAFS